MIITPAARSLLALKSQQNTFDDYDLIDVVFLLVVFNVLSFVDDYYSSSCNVIRYDRH